MKLSGKIALITGGTSGIGLATARLFKEQGAKVIATARTAESFGKAKRDLGDQFEIVKTDVSNLEELSALYSHIKARYDGLDILFANAGVAFFLPTSEIDQSFFDQQFNTNVRGLYFTVAKAIPLMRKASTVLLNASVISNKGIAGASVYAATKAAVRSFARSWTAEFPAEDIRRIWPNLK